MNARLSVLDEIFLRTHRGMGTPIALQGVWRTADPVDPAVLRALHAELRAGPLGRRVRRARVPGARRAWVHTVRAEPLLLEPDPIPVSALLDWADRRGEGLDPETGPGWRLAGAALDDGGAVVSLTCSHVLADGRALVHAADTALRAVNAAFTGSAPPEPRPDPPAALDARADWSDARRQWSVVLGGTARAGLAAARGVTRRRARSAGPGTDGADSAGRDSGRAGGTDRSSSAGAGPGTARDTYRPGTGSGSPTPRDGRSRGAAGTAPVTTSLAAQCPMPIWDARAAAADGTPNSLFVALIARTLWELGYPAEELTASLPVDTRAEPRVDNDLAMTSVRVARTDNPARLREKAKAAYDHRMTSPAGLPEEILQIIPDRWAYGLSRGAGERDILCSNIGPLPAAIGALGSSRCTGMAARAIHPGLRADRLPRTKLSGYLCHLHDEYTLALVGLDPTRTAADLRAALLRAAAAFELPLTPW